MMFRRFWQLWHIFILKIENSTRNNSHTQSMPKYHQEKGICLHWFLHSVWIYKHASNYFLACGSFKMDKCVRCISPAQQEVMHLVFLFALTHVTFYPTPSINRIWYLLCQDACNGFNIKFFFFSSPKFIYYL